MQKVLGKVSRFMFLILLERKIKKDFLKSRITKLYSLVRKGWVFYLSSPQFCMPPGWLARMYSLRNILIVATSEHKSTVNMLNIRRKKQHCNSSVDMFYVRYTNIFKSLKIGWQILSSKYWLYSKLENSITNYYYSRN